MGPVRVRAILDTSVLIAIDVQHLEGELAISAVSVAELHFGVLVATDDGVRAERLRRLATLQRTFTALAVDDAVASSYGELAAAVCAKIILLSPAEGTGHHQEVGASTTEEILTLLLRLAVCTE